MKTKLTICTAIAAAFLIASNAHAEETSKVSVGMVYVAGDSIYNNVESKSDIMPSISYESGAISISVERGFAYQLMEGKEAQIGVSVAPKFRPYKSTDSSALTGMTRAMYFDGSVDASYQLSRGLTAKVKLSTELTNKFNGNSADLSISQFIPIFGQPLVLQAGAKWLGAKRANYLYGVKATEATSLRVQYAPGSSILPYLSVNTFYSLTKQTSLFANMSANFLPSNVADSPIVARSRSVSSVLGLTYRF